MTRQDYELIARAIHLTDVETDVRVFTDADAEREMERLDAQLNERCRLARAIATALAGDNARFDRARFLNACGVDDRTLPEDGPVSS